MSSAVRQLVCKIGAIVTIAPIFAVYANSNDGATPSQSNLLLEIQALRKEVAELRNIIDMQAYQLQQIQQQTGISVTSQQATQDAPQNYNQFPNTPPSASSVAYDDPVSTGQQNLPVVDEVQIGGNPAANNPDINNNVPQGQADFTQAPTIYPEDNQYQGNNEVPTQPPVNDGTAIDAGDASSSGGTPLLRPNVSTTLSEDVLYQQAFTNLKEANHKQAVAQFKTQLQTYPSGEYADDALYWIGESSYVNRSLAESKKHFQLLVEQYSTSHRVPDALLKIAMIEKEQGNKSKARELLKRVIKQHPKSNAAISAKNSLAHL